MLLTPLLVLFLTPATAPAQAPRRPTPGVVAARFYRTYLRLNVRGLPDEKQLKTLAPLLSPDLRRLFEAAGRKQAQFIREHPGEKPPWADGDLFTSLFEGAQTFRLGAPKVSGDRAEVPVRLSYRAGGSTSRWSDTLVLTRTRDGWRVWDILLQGDWPFKSGSSLRNILSAG